MSALSWEGVRDSRDRRCVIYWRLTAGPERTDSVGSVARKPEGVRAILYDWTRGNPARTELGYFQSVPRAKRAVEQAVEARRDSASVVDIMGALQRHVADLRRAREDA